MIVIIDASVGLKWLAPEEDSAIAVALLDHELQVPALFHSEVANALWKKARRGEIEIGLLIPQLATLRLFAGELDDADHIPRALEIACELGHPVYDCVYLAAAEDLNETLVTADMRFVDRLRSTPYASRVIALAEFGAAT